jgi:hypothetical protein
VAAAVAVEQVLAPTQVHGVLQDLEEVMSLLSWHDSAPAASPWHVTGMYSETINDYGDMGGGENRLKELTVTWQVQNTCHSVTY